ncbi:DUF2325 domain-containing protein [Aquabacterium sp. OR-4]|uniref:DUF2325 domain-containing protein n=1 Tax=Aquabacterium sp. OR-4 TaxID=2978127 RepID=UPI0021B409F3|nr:DUF2325 domain-containing protein [Aquabacterium sp. OR-4]MDT7838107.1 DUF2325 domain-containing protein [Aquabacterium sp. OR-4]
MCQIRPTLQAGVLAAINAPAAGLSALPSGTLAPQALPPFALATAGGGREAPAPLTPLTPLTPQALPTELRAPGSRRRRLWELDSHAFCPVIGVCLPIDAVRQLVQREYGDSTPADDYELHCEAIAASKRRSALAERLQQALDERYADALRTVRGCKSTEALAAHWREALAGDGVAGALWATLTHARCDALLEEQVLHDVHMLQHQWGAAERADRRRLRELQVAHERLQQTQAALHARQAEQLRQQAVRLEQMQASLVQLRGELLGRDTRIEQLEETLLLARQAAPDLAPRRELQAQVLQLRERLVGLDRALRQARLAAARPAPATPADAGSAQAAAAQAAANPLQQPLPWPVLAQRSVLCVGGRSRAVPVYRHVIEGEGARFAHHDGGNEHSPAQLDAHLAAADLVICQTGCISHDAYWRVKSHCKRTGKPCLFVEQPSRSGLQRALGLGRPGAEAGPASPPLAAPLAVR